MVDIRQQVQNRARQLIEELMIATNAFTPPVEGKLVARVPELEVGQRIRVKLVATNVERGFIDFVLID